MVVTTSEILSSRTINSGGFAGPLFTYGIFDTTLEYILSDNRDAHSLQR